MDTTGGVGAEPWGEVEGRPVHRFRLDNGEIGLVLTDYGARLTELHLPDREGRRADVVLGFDDVADYVASPAYFGATVGRYGNRITRGRFSLLGRDYALDTNEGPNTLHGGTDGWDRRVWAAAVDPDGRAVTFSTTSPDGDMGFPGACAVRSRYALEGSGLRIVMEVAPDATTVVNVVHHSYFNLAGHDAGDVLGQQLRIAGAFYTPVDGALLPTGEIRGVAGTAYDFTTLRTIGDQLEGGWDHNWCLGGADARGLIEAAEVYDPASGRRLRLWSSEPGVQMYSGGYLSGDVVGKGGRPYRRCAGLTLETQKYPDAPNVGHFPSTVVPAGATYRHEMLFAFSTD